MLSKFDELNLITRCVMADSRDAFGVLVCEYQSEIRRFFMNLTGDAALSDDLSQETFIKAYTSIRRFRMMSRFRTWLYRIAYNEFYSYYRQQKQTEEVTESVWLATFEQSVDAQLDISEALKILNECERSAVVLYFMEDKPIKEISKIMAMPEGTVKSHLSRAKDKMAKFIS